MITRRRSTVNPRRWVYLVPDNTTGEVKNDTTDFSLTDPSITQKVVELTLESIDRQETELNQQLVNNSANEVNSLVNTNPVEASPVELKNLEPEEDTAVSQQNQQPALPEQKRSTRSEACPGFESRGTCDSVVQAEGIESCTTQKEAIQTDVDRLQYFVPGAIQVGDRVQVLVGVIEDRLGTVEAIDPKRVLTPYHIRLDNGGTTDEPLFNLEPIVK